MPSFLFLCSSFTFSPILSSSLISYHPFVFLFFVFSSFSLLLPFLCAVFPSFPFFRYPYFIRLLSTLPPELLSIPSFCLFFFLSPSVIPSLLSSPSLYSFHPLESTLSLIPLFFPFSISLSFWILLSLFQILLSTSRSLQYFLPEVLSVTLNVIYYSKYSNSGIMTSSNSAEKSPGPVRKLSWTPFIPNISKFTLRLSPPVLARRRLDLSKRPTHSSFARAVVFPSTWIGQKCEIIHIVMKGSSSLQTWIMHHSFSS